MMYDDIDSPGVERDMFGREITTHNRRFSNSSSTPSRPASHHNSTAYRPHATPTEESPLLPVFDIGPDGTEGNEGGDTEHEEAGNTSTPNMETANNNTSSTSVMTKRYFFVSMTLLIVLSLIINAYFFYSLRALHTHSYQQHQQINALQRSHHDYTKDFTRRLEVIENMTSNADVLKEIRHTEHRVDDALHQEQKEIQHQLGVLQANVTSTIHYSEHIIDKKLSHVDAKLATTTTHIQSLLAASEANVTREIRSVSAELEAEEVSLQRLHANVTKQISQLGGYMNSSITAVNTMVTEAKKKIKTEVKEVYASLDQYITSTSAQFAAENDFVKYQVAGSFCLLACLISLYHVTSHLR